MYKKIKILLCDYDWNLMENIKSRLSLNKNFSFEMTNSGREAIEMLKSRKFSILITDLLLKEKDGFEVIKFIKDNNINTRTIVISDVLKRGVVKEAVRLGAWYFIAKDTEFDLLKSRVEFIAQVKDKGPFNQSFDKLTFVNGDKIDRELIRLGFISNRQGYIFLKEAIELVLGDKDYLKKVTLNLYPDVALNTESTKERVESSMRNVIKETYKNSRQFRDFMEAYGLDPNIRPTVSQIINCFYRHFKEEVDV